MTIMPWHLQQYSKAGILVVYLVWSLVLVWVGLLMGLVGVRGLLWCDEMRGGLLYMDCVVGASRGGSPLQSFSTSGWDEDRMNNSTSLGGKSYTYTF